MQSDIRNNDDGYSTATSHEQFEVEESIRELRAELLAAGATVSSLKLKRSAHEAFIRRSLSGLNRWFVSLDASKPWIVMWMLHALDLLGVTLTDSIKSRAVTTIKSCQNTSGGFSGGHGQISHLATTYAAISALAIIGTREAYDAVDRPKLYEFLLQMKQPDGSFRMHEGGEVDVRGTYCAINSAYLLNILTPALEHRAAEFISRCQSYEGGIGPLPGIEAHGGYTFCAVAAMEILGKMDMLDIDSLMAWSASRLMSFEGGFQGRTNKLVDGCYSFWQGGIARILEIHLSRKQGRESMIYIFLLAMLHCCAASETDILISSLGLILTCDIASVENYTLSCCQAESGGLIDKPGKNPDFYHTCYCLSGLSVAQHVYVSTDPKLPLVAIERDDIAGPRENMLQPTHPVHNICMTKLEAIKAYFYPQNA
eukprot:jgi/Hompol1/7050/HPOL_000471-RA